jgi:hypothetical protein
MIDRIDRIHRIDRIDSIHSIHRIDRIDSIHIIERIDSIHRIDRIDSIQCLGIKVSSVDRIKNRHKDHFLPTRTDRTKWKIIFKRNAAQSHC